MFLIPFDCCAIFKVSHPRDFVILFVREPNDFITHINATLSAYHIILDIVFVLPSACICSCVPNGLIVFRYSSPVNHCNGALSVVFARWNTAHSAIISAAKSSGANFTLDQNAVFPRFAYLATLAAYTQAPKNSAHH